MIHSLHAQPTFLKNRSAFGPCQTDHGNLQQQQRHNLQHDDDFTTRELNNHLYLRPLQAET